jgi:hypothetical protein
MNIDAALINSDVRAKRQCTRVLLRMGTSIIGRSVDHKRCRIFRPISTSMISTLQVIVIRITDCD